MWGVEPSIISLMNDTDEREWVAANLRNSASPADAIEDSERLRRSSPAATTEREDR